MDKTDRRREITLTIPMLPDMEVTATQTAEAVLRFMQFGEDEIDEVKHALVEGCINAFEHSLSTDGRVHIRFVMEADVLQVVIQDFGLGFDAEAVPAPVLVEKLEGGHKRGWGLMMMRALMDGVEIASGPAGTRVTMTKRRGADAAGRREEGGSHA